jgi:hypothetical protein
MEWGPGYQIYNVNGKVTKRVYADYVPDNEHYILLNSGVESAHPPTSATVFPNALEVDYVRVYARPEVAVLHNGGFEADDGQRPWGTSGQVVRVNYGAHGGTYALRVDGGPSTSEQTLFGLKPGTTYVLSGWVKMLTADGEARLGVKGHGGEETFARATARDYRPLRLSFTTGPQATMAIVYCYVPDKTGAALFDDLELRQQ